MLDWIAARALLAGALLAPPALSATPPQGNQVVDPAVLEQADAEFEAAFKKGEPADRLRVIGRYGHLVHEDVVGWLATGLRDRDGDVEAASMKALGRLDHPDALKALEAFYKKDKKRLLKDEKALPVLLTEIARHGHEGSVEILTDSMFKQPAYPTIKARILGLGNIRSADSIEGLFEMMKRVSFNRAADYMDDLRLSLYLLTGQDQGNDPRQWDAWWRRNKKGFHVSKEAPELPKAARERWDRHWGNLRDKKGEGEQ